MMRITVTATLAAAGLLAACNTYAEAPSGTAQAASVGGRQCFYAPNIMGYRKGAGDTVVVNTNSRDYYQFETQSHCANRIDWQNRIALRSRTGDFICNGYDAEIYVPEAVTPMYCPLYHMHKLTPAEVAALRATPPTRR